MISFKTSCAIGAVIFVIAAGWQWFTMEPKAYIKLPDPEYDFIIVGAGTAGCVLASRLSENPNNKILLVESGGHFGIASKVPVAAPIVQRSDNDWQLETEQQKNSSQGLVNQVAFWPRGKGLGGSGQMNYLLHFQGNKKDFDEWERLGNEGWSYNNIQRYMNKITGKKYLPESFMDSCDKWKKPTQNVRGSKYTTDKPRVRLTKQDRENNALLNALMDAASEIIYPKVDVKPCATYVYKGVRWSTYHSYLEPALDRPNLHVLINTSVKRVLLNERKTKGVELLLPNGEVLSVLVKREVVLSAGAVHSPHILMLSGIGAKQHLEELKIPVVADLPVGENLHDHLNIPIYVSIEKPVSLTLDKALRFKPMMQYLFARSGYLSDIGITGTVTSHHNIGIILFGMGSTDERLLRKMANYELDVYNSIFPFSKNMSQEGFVLLISCLQPRSRGTVKLRDTSISSPPVIDPNYLEFEDDIECTRRGIKLAKRITITKSFQKLKAKAHLPYNLNACSEFEANINDNDYLSCVIKTIGFTGYHPGGTVPMGNDSRAVIDHNLRVKGIEGLRVVDASVFPTPVSGTPNSVIVAIAERAAQIILSSYCL